MRWISRRRVTKVKRTAPRFVFQCRSVSSSTSTSFHLLQIAADVRNSLLVCALWPDAVIYFIIHFNLYVSDKQFCTALYLVCLDSSQCFTV